MLDILKRAAWDLRAGMLRRRALRALGRMSGSGEDAVRSLAAALGAAIRGEADEAESAWIERIESMRARLNASTDEIRMTDYGAGTRGPGDGAGGARGAARTVGEICRKASKSRFWSFVLLRLIREMRPSVCLELGTCLGVSAAFEGAALALNGNGRLVTLEGDETLAALARENMRSLGLDAVTIVTGRFQDTLGGVIESHRPIDYAFIDGHHDGEATLRYFEMIAPALSDRAVLVFDDISWSKGMERAWKTIEADRRIGVSVDLRQVGIGVAYRGSGPNLSYRIPLLGG